MIFARKDDVLVVKTLLASGSNRLNKAYTTKKRMICSSYYGAQHQRVSFNRKFNQVSHYSMQQATIINHLLLRKDIYEVFMKKLKLLKEQRKPFRFKLENH